MSNGHLFAWLAKGAGEQKQLIDFLDAKGIESHSHYRSLHSSHMSTGSGIGREAGDFEFTQNLPFRIVRLPIHSMLSIDDVDRVAEAIKLFYSIEPIKNHKMSSSDTRVITSEPEKLHSYLRKVWKYRSMSWILASVMCASSMLVCC